MVSVFSIQTPPVCEQKPELSSLQYIGEPPASSLPSSGEQGQDALGRRGGRGPEVPAVGDAPGAVQAARDVTHAHRHAR